MDSNEMESESNQLPMENAEAQTETELESDSPDTPSDPEPSKGDKWRFAFDVMKTVIRWNTGNSIWDCEEPPHENFLFTNVHHDYIVEFLEENKKQLKKLVVESTKESGDWDYNDDNYQQCERKILEEYKPEIYSEKEFVRLCAGIAFIAIGNQCVQQNPLAVTFAVNLLHAWMKEVLKPGGTLQNSTWAEDLELNYV